MRLYFTLRQVPECSHLDADQVAAVQRDVLQERFRRSIWMVTLAVLCLGSVGSYLTQRWVPGSDGIRLLGGMVGSLVAALGFVPGVIHSSRPAIKAYLSARGW